jgi:PHD/YefM family antitoxin component YafN of YafNO toxin-antitoxin module
MLITSLTAFRKNTAKYFDLVIDSHDTLLVKRANVSTFVILSLDEYRTMIESCQRYSTTANDLQKHQDTSKK